MASLTRDAGLVNQRAAWVASEGPRDPVASAVLGVLRQIGAEHFYFVDLNCKHETVCERNETTCSLWTMGWNGLLFGNVKSNARFGINSKNVTNTNVERVLEQYGAVENPDVVIVSSQSLWTSLSVVSSKFAPRLLLVDHNRHLPWGVPIAEAEEGVFAPSLGLVGSDAAARARPGNSSCGGGASAFALDNMASAHGYAAVAAVEKTLLFARRELVANTSLANFSLELALRDDFVDAQIEPMSVAEALGFLDYGVWALGREALRNGTSANFSARDDELLLNLASRAARQHLSMLGMMSAAPGASGALSCFSNLRSADVAYEACSRSPAAADAAAAASAAGTVRTIVTAAEDVIVYVTKRPGTTLIIVFTVMLLVANCMALVLWRQGRLVPIRDRMRDRLSKFRSAGPVLLPFGSSTAAAPEPAHAEHTDAVEMNGSTRLNGEIDADEEKRRQREAEA